jgi:hypothetical protein
VEPAEPPVARQIDAGHVRRAGIGDVHDVEPRSSRDPAAEGCKAARALDDQGAAHLQEFSSPAHEGSTEAADDSSRTRSSRAETRLARWAFLVSLAD